MSSVLYMCIYTWFLLCNDYNFLLVIAQQETYEGKLNTYCGWPTKKLPCLLTKGHLKGTVWNLMRLLEGQKKHYWMLEKARQTLLWSRLAARQAAVATARTINRKPVLMVVGSNPSCDKGTTKNSSK